MEDDIFAEPEATESQLLEVFTYENIKRSLIIVGNFNTGANKIQSVQEAIGNIIIRKLLPA